MKPNAHIADQRNRRLVSSPVEDEALLGIALHVFNRVYNDTHVTKGAQQRTSISAVIVAIRPYIEAIERERCAKALEITSDEIRLHAGEMTAQEMRNVLAVLTWRAAAIRSGTPLFGRERK